MIRETASWIGSTIFKIFLAGVIFTLLVLGYIGQQCSEKNKGFKTTVYVSYSSEKDRNGLMTFQKIEDARFEGIGKMGAWGKGYKIQDNFTIWKDKVPITFSFHEIRQFCLFENGWVFVGIKGSKKWDYIGNEWQEFRLCGETENGEITIYLGRNKFLNICFYEPEGNIY